MVPHTDNLYFPIHLDTLRVDTIRSFDIFIKVKNKKMILYHTGGDKFTAEVRNNLLENKINVAYIRRRDKEVYNRYLEENLNSILNDPDITGEQKAEIAHLSIINVAQSLFERPLAKTIKRYKAVISSTMDFVLGYQDAINNLIRLTSYDFNTYTHSVNVGIFAIGLAKILFADNPEHNMNEIAAGFFLHDIGKCSIPLPILTKPAPLTTDEWEIMKRHPYEGNKLLGKFNALTEEAKVIVMEHHERHDGKGYPKRLKGDEIHIYSKICCIADVFEALTGTRPYKNSHSSFHALNIMKNEMREEFDPYFFEQFILLFSHQVNRPTKKKVFSR